MQGGGGEGGWEQAGEARELEINEKRERGMMGASAWIVNVLHDSVLRLLFRFSVRVTGPSAGKCSKHPTEIAHETEVTRETENLREVEEMFRELRRPTWRLRRLRP